MVLKKREALRSALQLAMAELSLQMLHHAMSLAAEQFHLGANDGVFAARLLILVMNYKDAKVLHVCQPALLSSQRVSRPSIWWRRNSRSRFPLSVFRKTRLSAKKVRQQVEGRRREIFFAESALHQPALLSPPGQLLEADIAAVPAERRDEMRHVVEFESGVGQAGKVFEVHAHPVVAIQQQSRVDNATAKERRGGWNVAAKVHKDGTIEVVLDFRADDLPGAVDENAIAIDDIGFGMVLGGARDGLADLRAGSSRRH